MIPLVGRPDWGTAVLARPQVVDADPTGRSGALGATAAAALVAVADGDGAAAAAAAAFLGPAAVVAVRRGNRSLEVRQTLDGWELVASSAPTPDAGDLGAAALVRAWRLADARRTGEGGR